MIQGCGVTDNRPNSYGAGFNSNGGGVYAMQWTSSGIKVPLLSPFCSFFFTFFPLFSFSSNQSFVFLVLLVDLCMYRFGSSPETPFQETSQITTPIPLAGALLLPTSPLVCLSIEKQNKKEERKKEEKNNKKMQLTFSIYRRQLPELILPEPPNRP